MGLEEQIMKAINRVEEKNHRVKVVCLTQKAANELIPINGLSLESIFGHTVVISDSNKIIFTREETDSIEIEN